MKKIFASKLFWLAAVPLLLVLLLVKIGTWNSRGGVSAFLAGQFAPALDLDDFRDVHARPAAASVYRVRLERADLYPLYRISPYFLSFAIDTSQVVGGKWWNPAAEQTETGTGTHTSPVLDWSDPRLNRLTAALAPAYLRIGGSEADKTYYDLNSDAQRVEEAPPGYHSVMTRRQWDDLNRFAAARGLRLVFCLNNGPSARDAEGRWRPDNARELLEYSAQQGYRVSVWEMGNELNLFWYVYGPAKMVPPEIYARDLEVGRALVKEFYPRSGFAGQSAAFWPVLGEPLQFFFAFQEDYLRTAGDRTDIVGWHYYPQQSRRGPIASRRAAPARLLDPDNLNETRHWAEYVAKLRDEYAPERPLWLGEVGNAQFGGEPGVSSVYIGSLWWLDQLGQMALTGHEVVVRQTLTGMDYGMIDYPSMKPRPDYWVSLLWKKLMTGSVFPVALQGEDTEKLRAYWHGSDAGDTVLLINLDHERAARVELPQFKQRPVDLYALTAPDVLGDRIELNGRRLATEASGAVPALPPQTLAPVDDFSATVPPLGILFLQAR